MFFTLKLLRMVQAFKGSSSYPLGWHQAAIAALSSSGCLQGPNPLAATLSEVTSCSNPLAKTTNLRNRIDPKILEPILSSSRALILVWNHTQRLRRDERFLKVVSSLTTEAALDLFQGDLGRPSSNTETLQASRKHHIPWKEANKWPVSLSLFSLHTHACTCTCGYVLTKWKLSQLSFLVVLAEASSCWSLQGSYCVHFAQIKCDIARLVSLGVKI